MIHFKNDVVCNAKISIRNDARLLGVVIDGALNVDKRNMI